MDVRRVTEPELDAVVEFMVRLNRDARHHIGYCDEDEDAFRRALADFSLPPLQTFTIAVEGDAITGALGFDGDMDLGRAWVYGPFVEGKDPAFVSDLLWTASVGLLPQPVHEVELFFDIRNRNCQAFAESHDFSYHKDTAILSLRKDDWIGPRADADAVEEFDERFFTDLQRLHDAAFPATFWTARQMVERQNDQRRLFAVTDDDRLTGYLYAEVDPRLDQGSIEFLAVDPAARRKGVGATLIDAALRWAFSFSDVYEIFLVLDDDNVVAGRLYESRGFRVIRRMRSFRKDLARAASDQKGGS